MNAAILPPLDGAPAALLARVWAAPCPHVLIVAHPGSAVTMVARRVAANMPGPRGFADRWEAATIRAWAGLPVHHGDHWQAGAIRDPGPWSPTAAPFRAPHHTCSAAGLFGGGRPLRPGEVTLAHGGVLYLDDVAEFTRACIEGIADVLDRRKVQHWRRGRLATAMPARFRLIASALPCPCGYLGHRDRACVCPTAAVRRYRRRWEVLADRPDVAWLDVTGAACPACGAAAGVHACDTGDPGCVHCDACGHGTGPG